MVETNEGDPAMISKYYRIETLNHIGYVVATAVASLGLFSCELFVNLLGAYSLGVPLTVLAILVLLAYLGVRTINLARDLFFERGSGFSLEALLRGED